jgi:DNA-binding GntR family transcriptional regulator
LAHESEISRWDVGGQPASPSPTESSFVGRPAVRLIAERAYFELRDRIVTLRLPPGSALAEDGLMRELEIGRTPLREAIKRLALENLVEVRPRRGTYVTEINVADIVHITEVRAELEGHAAQLAAMRMDDERSGEAEALLAELEELDPQDSPALMRIDERVHRLAWEALLCAVSSDLVPRARPRPRTLDRGPRPTGHDSSVAHPRRSPRP